MNVTILKPLQNLQGLSRSIAKGAALIKGIWMKSILKDCFDFNPWDKNLVQGHCKSFTWGNYEADKAKGRDDMLWARLLQRSTMTLTFLLKNNFIQGHCTKVHIPLLQDYLLKYEPDKAKGRENMVWTRILQTDLLWLWTRNLV